MRNKTMQRKKWKLKLVLYKCIWTEKSQNKLYALLVRIVQIYLQMKTHTHWNAKLEEKL